MLVFWNDALYDSFHLFFSFGWARLWQLEDAPLMKGAQWDVSWTLNVERWTVETEGVREQPRRKNRFVGNSFSSLLVRFFHQPFLSAIFMNHWTNKHGCAFSGERLTHLLLHYGRWNKVRLPSCSKIASSTRFNRHPHCMLVLNQSFPFPC